MYNQQQQQQSAGGETEMRVRKRDGALEVIAFDKILARVKTLGARAHVFPIRLKLQGVKVAVGINPL